MVSGYPVPAQLAFLGAAKRANCNGLYRWDAQLQVYVKEGVGRRDARRRSVADKSLRRL